MADSVIDSLVVTLGLDSKGFAEGVKGSTEQLASFTRKLAGMFIAVKGIEDVVGYFKDLHAQLAEIGFTSKNLGVAGTELKKLGEVSELFGGQMSDATASVENLEASVFSLRYRGQMSESLVMLQRFGIAYLDAAGHARNFRDVAKDAAAAIERQAKVAGLNQGERYQMALSMGFTGGVASAVAQGGKGLEEALGRAQIDQRALTEKTIEGQVALEKQLISQHEALAAVNSTLLAQLTPAISKLNQWMQELVSKAIPLLVKTIQEVIAFFKNPPPWLALIESALKDLSAALGPSGTLLLAIGTLATALVSLPLAIAGALGLLLGQLLRSIPGVGKVIDSFNEFILDQFGPQYDPNAPAAAAKGAIARGGRPTIPPPTPTAPRPLSAAEQSAAAGQPSGIAGGAAGNTTNVQIDSINVHTRATDAEGIGKGIGGATRKALVSSADPGQG